MARTVAMPLSLAPTPKSGWWNVTTSHGSSRRIRSRSATDSGSDSGLGPDQVLPRGDVPHL